MSENNLFELKDIAKRFVKGKETITIFEHLNLNIVKGDFIAIMGPSGSGKTTLMNLLGGIDQPSTGELLFEGDRVDTLSESELAKWRANNIGFIFQFYNLMPMLNAEKNVELPLLLTHLNSNERKKTCGHRTSISRLS